MGLELTINLPDPHAKQLAFLRSPAKRKVVCAGRRGGKTTGMVILAIESMLAGRRVLEAAPVSAQTDAFWDAVKAALAEPIAAGIIRKNETDRLVEMPSGARIRCKTAHNADTLRGDYADLLILDEFSLMDPSAWDQVGAPMLLDNDGDAAFIFTPRSMNFAYTLYQRAISEDSGRWEAFHFTSLDNPYLSREALAEITQDMTENDYAQEILARFLQNQGAVFRNVDACLTAPSSTPAAHAGHFTVGGLDWAKVHDYTALSIYCCKCNCELFLDRFNTVAWDFQRQRVLAALDKWNVEICRVETNSIGGPNLEALRDAARDSLNLMGFEMTQKSKPKLIQALALSLEKGESRWLPDQIARHELIAYEATVTESGYTKYGAPAGAHDDTVICRALAWKTANANMPIGITEDERREQSLPAGLRRESVDERGLVYQRDIAEFMRDVKLSERKKERREEDRNWTQEIVEIEEDDPWKSAFKDPVW